MLGTIINAIAIIIGGTLGLVLKTGIKDRYRIIVTQAQGIAVVFVGISGAVSSMQEKDAHPILFIISLVVGALLGEWVNIEFQLEKLGKWIENKFQGNDSNIATGFVNASLLFCIGTMAVLGSIESGINGDHSILFVKSILDGVIAVVLASSLGLGVVFSACTVFLYQGAITLGASVLQPYITGDILREIGIVGGILITIIGLNLLEITKIKVGNMLPAIAIPVIYYMVIAIV